MIFHQELHWSKTQAIGPEIPITVHANYFPDQNKREKKFNNNIKSDIKRIKKGIKANKKERYYKEIIYASQWKQPNERDQLNINNSSCSSNATDCKEYINYQTNSLVYCVNDMLDSWFTLCDSQANIEIPFLFHTTLK